MVEQINSMHLTFVVETNKRTLKVDKEVESFLDAHVVIEDLRTDYTYED